MGGRKKKEEKKRGRATVWRGRGRKEEEKKNDAAVRGAWLVRERKIKTKIIRCINEAVWRCISGGDGTCAAHC
jgi:hypothetical protein